MFVRRGFTVWEAAVAGAVLAALAAVCAQMLTASAEQNRLILDRQAAMNEATNVMERLFVQPWDQLTSDAAAQAALGDEFLEALPGGQLNVEVSTTSEPPLAKRIVVQIQWTDDPDQPPYSVRLAALKYQIAESEDSP